ncbi:MAG: hypothetical protein JRH11_12805 [Deltaproteobacteria bacterium]|nr:hypothetical protein [Deltaproteobacteria bacterium]
MPRFPVLFFVCSVVVVLAAACSVYDPSLVIPDDGGVVATGFQPPARPDISDGTDMAEIAFALRDVQLDQNDGRWRRIGFDLDGVTTGEPDRETSCVPPSGASPPTDGDQGRDNVFGESLFPTVKLAVEGLEASSRARQAEGVGSVLVRINGYNGAANDPRVDVTLAVTVFGTTAADNDGVVLDVAGIPRVAGRIADFPAWDGTDFFYARDDNFIGGDVDRPSIRDNNAYVANGFLVARIPARTDFIFPGEEIGVLARLTGGILVGRLGGDRQELQDVTIAGRWGIGDLLTTAASVGACPGAGDTTIFTNLLDTIADVRSEPGSGGPGVECDAISTAIVFQGFRANFGGAVPGPSLSDACAP